MPVDVSPVTVEVTLHALQLIDRYRLQPFVEGTESLELALSHGLESCDVRLLQDIIRVHVTPQVLPHPPLNSAVQRAMVVNDEALEGVYVALGQPFQAGDRILISHDV